jgi:hypothetical protein
VRLGKIPMASSLAAPLGVDLVVGQPGCAGGMQPVELAGHSRSGLIMMRDRFLLDQVLLHLLVDLSDLLGTVRQASTIVPSLTG